MTDVFGPHAVSAVLAGSPQRVRALYVQRGRRDKDTQRLIEAAKVAKIRVEFVDRQWLDRKVDGNHQGIAADCHEVETASDDDLISAWDTLPSPRLLLVLDGVVDPRNLGACLRSAKAAGVQAVILPRRRSAPISPAAVKTAAGAVEGLFIVEVSNLARRLKWLQQQGVWLVGADGAAARTYDAADLSTDVAILMGSEDKGLRPLTAKHCDDLVRIPMAHGVESLNVSVACGILLFEALRQRAA